MSNNTIQIKNNGKAIIDTNWKDLPIHEPFLSFYAKTLRLLIPDQFKEQLTTELTNATEIEVIFYDYEIKVWLKKNLTNKYILKISYNNSDIKINQKVKAKEFTSYVYEGEKLTKLTTHKLKIHNERGKKLNFEN